MPIQIGSLTLNSRVYVPPMAGVTDLVFRNMVRTIDRNCLLATEMVSSKALMYRSECRIMDLDTNERPTGIQIFGHEPDVMAKAAQMAEAKGADFIDINMGCPVPKITKGKDGCALMKEPGLAEEIVKTVSAAINIPLTVKFRLGWDDSTRNCVQFGEMLQNAGARAVTVHGRTRQQLYSGKADWSFIAQVKKALSVPVFGNGDVFEPEDAIKLLEIAGVDGVAVARGTLGNPWLIPRITNYIETGKLEDGPTDIERLITAYRHCLGLILYKGQKIGANESRRHLTHYTKGIVGSAPFRARLTQINSAADAAVILTELAEQVGGSEGRRDFINAQLEADSLAVQNADLKNGENPGERNGNGERRVHTPVNLVPFSPIAKP
ncbi:MAG TPA: tRNA dihydrouridine synthase DusB [Oculatellaceae cyanobacterium]